MKILRVLGTLVAAAWLAATVPAASLPLETTVTQPTKFEILRNGKPSGSVGLAQGAVLEVISLEGTELQVRYRSLIGRVPVAHTALAALVAAQPAAPVVAVTPAPAAAKGAPAPAAVDQTSPAAGKPRLPPAASPKMAQRLQGKLVRLQGNALKPVGPAPLAGVQFYALYFSASWCGPCRQFTPDLVEAYRQLKADYPEFEVVLVSADRSAGDMKDYMTEDKMAWPAVRYEAIGDAGEIRAYCGDGIPCLVLVDSAGKVLSDTNRNGDYVGPRPVLEDTRELLRKYRQKHPLSGS